MKKSISLFLCCFFVSFSFAQDIPLLEKAHEISRKSKKGYLGQVVVNQQSNVFDLIFVLKGSRKDLIKTEIYSFDKELNLIDTKRDEIDVEVARKRYTWFKYRGDEVKFEMLSVNANFKNEMVFRRKEITQHFNWWLGGYTNSLKLLERVRPSDETGEKYGFRGGFYDNYLTGKMLLLAGVKSTFDKKGFGEYDIISADKDIKIDKMDKISFQGPMVPVYSAPITDEESENSTNEDNPRDWIVVFAPSEGKKQKMKSTEYTYVRISPLGKIIEKVAFASPTNGWRILSAIEQGGIMTLVGSGIEKGVDNKYFTDLFEAGTVSMVTMTEEEQKITTESKSGGVAGILMGKEAAGMLGKFTNPETAIPTQELLQTINDNLKYDHFIVGQIKAGQFKTNSYADIDEFEKTHKKPSNQKSYYDFDGKRFSIDHTGVFSDGSLVVTGQDFDKDRVFKEAYLFKYAADGKLQANYGIKLDQKGRSGFMSGDGPKPDQYQVRNVVYESVDKKRTYWFMNKVKAIRQQAESDYSYDFINGIKTTTTTKVFTPLRSIQYAGIDNTSLAISDTKDLGEDEKRDFYLFNKNNQRVMNQYILFFSETKNGDKILISRFDKSK